MKLINDNFMPFIKKYGIICFLFMIFIFPLSPFLLTDGEHKVSFNSLNQNELVSLKNSVSQKIMCNGKLKKLGIYFKVERKIDDNSFVEILLKNAKTSLTYNLPVGKIKNNDINYLDLNFGKFGHVSDITIFLNLSPSTENNVFVGNTTDCCTGTEGFVVLNVQQANPLCMSYEYFHLTTSVIIGCILYFLLILLLVLFVYLIDKDVNSMFFAVISFFFIVFIICVRQPCVSYFGEPRSEAAYDFWYKAHTKGLFGSILDLECNLYYLSFLQRITAWIADLCSPNSKYVIVFMQMIQVVFIACASSLVWNNKIKLNLSRFSKFVLSVSLGTLFTPLYMYFFHFFGYWGIIFLLITTILDFDKLKLLPYCFVLFLTSICCLSKMAYVVFVPYSIVELIIFNRRLKKKRVVWYIDIVSSCCIQVLYTFSHTTVFSFPEGALGVVRFPSLFEFINSIFYYAVQGINTFLFNSIHSNPLIFNLLSLFFILIMMLVAIYEGCIENNFYYKRLISLGAIYFSVIGFCLFTSAGGFNMLESVNWKQNILLIHPHFTFLKFILVFFIINCFGILYEKNDKLKIANLFIPILISLITLVSYPVNEDKGYLSTSNIHKFPTEWRKSYKILKNDFYYLPINIEYKYAGISLAHNTYGLLYGYKNGVFSKLVTGESFDTNIKYSKSFIPNVSDKGIVSINVHKVNSFYETPYRISLFDSDGKKLGDYIQVNSLDREWTNFLFDIPIYDVSYIEFYDGNTGKECYVDGELNLGVCRGDYRLKNNRIDFYGEMYNADSFLLSGFSFREEFGQWTEGKKSKLKFILPEQFRGRNIKISFDLCMTINDNQMIYVCVNKKKVLRKFNVKPGKLEFSIFVPNDGCVDLEIGLPRALSPKSIGVNNDSRILGIAIRTIEFINEG